MFAFPLGKQLSTGHFCAFANIGNQLQQLIVHRQRRLGDGPGEVIGSGPFESEIVVLFGNAEVARNGEELPGELFDFGNAGCKPILCFDHG